MTDLGEKLRKVREERGLSREALAQKLGIALAQLLDWEEDREAPDLEHLAKLCDGLGITIDDLLKDSFNTHPHATSTPPSTKWYQNKYFILFAVSLAVALFSLVDVFYIVVFAQVANRMVESVGFGEVFPDTAFSGISYLLLIPSACIMFVGFGASLYFWNKYQNSK